MCWAAGSSWCCMWGGWVAGNGKKCWAVGGPGVQPPEGKFCRGHQDYWAVSTGITITGQRVASTCMLGRLGYQWAPKPCQGLEP
jgi:hypothetical protein